MARIDDTPETKILKGVYATLQPVDWTDRAGVHEDKALTVRHYRMRRPISSAKPCLSIDWVGRSDNDTDELYKSPDERPMSLLVNLVIDLQPADEDNEDILDETGWEELTRVAAVALEALRAPDSPMAAVCDYVTDADRIPDEESKPEHGRLVQAISVVYRVRTDDTNVLLARGAN